jgi:hypothetical protein
MFVRSRHSFPQRVFERWLLAAALLSGPAYARGVLVQEATPAQQKAYEKKLAHANKLYKAGKFDAALKSFREAHDIVADPDASLMIARSQQTLGELLAAQAAYETAEQEAEAAAQQNDKYRPLLESIRKEQAELEGVLAHLTIKLVFAPQGTTLTIDGELVPAEKVGQPMTLTPGSVTVVATAPDGRESSKQVSLKAGEEHSVELAFARHDDEPGSGLEEGGTASEPQPKETSGGDRTLAYIAGGVGLAGLATFGVFGAMSNSKFGDLEEACPDNRCPANRQGDIDDGKTFQTFANVGLAVSVIGLGTSAALLIFGGSGEPAKEESAVLVGVGPRSLHVRGNF